MISFTPWDIDYKIHKEKYNEIFDNVMSTNNNENVESFEKWFADFIGREYAVSTNSATDALFYSLLAYGIGEGDEVLVSNFSWISTSSCITMAGATPVFCDINLNSYHISLDSIKRMTTNKTKALIYTHLFGNMTDTTEIINYCKENNIVFIEDAAQSLGSSLNNQRAGTIGDCSSFSFNSNKVIPGISGGGIFLTDNKEIANAVRKIRRHGKVNDFEILGYNSRMFLLNTEIIKFRIHNMYRDQKERQRIAQYYNEEFEELDLHNQVMHDELNHNYHKYVIRVENRKRLTEELKKSNIPYGIHYEKPLSENSMYNNINYKKDNYPNAKKASESVLSLPIHAYITDDQLDEIVNRVWANA